MRRWLLRVALGIAGVVSALVAYLLAWPVDVDPAAWTPPEAPRLTGLYAVNEALADVEWTDAHGMGPEDVAVDAEGRRLFGLDDGRIGVIDAAGAFEVFADTGGRPVGLDWDRAGHLIVADAHEGLLSIAPDGVITVLATEHEGRPFGLTDDVDVGPDGTIYFSDASDRWPIEQWKMDIIEHRPNGRLLAYDPVAKETELLLDGLTFANGVAVAPDGAFVLVVETGKYRVRRYWLAGEQAGSDDVLIDNLPGFPDGVSAGTGGVFWVALASPRNPALDWALPRPFWRKVMVRLPAFLQPAAERYGFVLGVDERGRVLHNLQDPSEASYSPITSVEEHEGVLHFGTIGQASIGRIVAP